MDNETVSTAVIGFLLVFVYFAPTVAAWNKSQRGSVFAINFFLGWTLVGWVIALAWAFKDEPKTQVVVQNIQPLGPSRFCASCGKYSEPHASFCSTCGNAFSKAAAI